MIGKRMLVKTLSCQVKILKGISDLETKHNKEATLAYQQERTLHAKMNKHKEKIELTQDFVFPI